MKGIYFSEGLRINESEKLGIERKVLSQVKCLESMGEVEFLNINLEKTKMDKILFVLPFIKSKREKNREVLLDKIDSSIDYIYIRKPSLSVHFYKLLKKIKKKNNNIIILMEIPTYPFHSEYSGIKKIMAIKSSLCEIKLKKVVDYIITYSNDDFIWGIPCLKTSNCVNYSSIKKRSDSYNIVNDTIRMTCVANFVYWHGMDRIIDGIKEYKGKYKIILNLVGEGPEIDNLKKRANNDKRIVFWGAKTGEELGIIFDKTDIAIDALGRHRSGVFYNSSLKGKEYTARGIPVVSAVETELDYFDNYKYYLKLPADDTIIKIEDIVKFYENIYFHDSPREITNKIRQLTEKKFDYKYGFEIPIKELIIELKGRNIKND